MNKTLFILTVIISLFTGLLLGYFLIKTNANKFDVKFMPRFPDETDRGLILINHSTGELMYLDSYHHSSKPIIIYKP